MLPLASAACKPAPAHFRTACIPLWAAGAVDVNKHTGQTGHSGLHELHLRAGELDHVTVLQMHRV